MSYNVEVSAKFKKHAKHLLKKFPSLKNELEQANVSDNEIKELLSLI
jgi:mRNA-degrading endonuclease RelE of RelBE toxin-antitoxin system